MLKKTIGYSVFGFIFFTGLLSFYRACLNTSDMTILSGKVLDKNISYIDTRGRTYYLAFRIEGQQDKIAINLGTRSEAEKDSTYYKVDTGKIYKFYIDPTVPITNNINWGITQIDYNNNVIFKGSKKLQLYFGGLLCILGLLLIFLTYKQKDKR